MKVFAQKTLDGGIRIAGIAIGKYESGWDKVFKPLQSSFEKMGEFHMIMDGDSAILKDFAAEIDFTVQRCLWHIPHQIKYYLWKDKVKHKSEFWKNIMTRTLLLTSLPAEAIEDDDLIEDLLKEKLMMYESLLAKLEKESCKHCITHLKNAWDDMFTSLTKKLNGKATSLIERLMRTVNLRINLGKWKESGALNLLKVRLAYYYNKEELNPKKKEYVEVQRIAN